MRTVAIACTVLILGALVAGLPTINTNNQQGGIAQPPAKEGDVGTAFNCEICDWVVGKVFQYAGNATSCAAIEDKIDLICNDVPFSPIGPALCRWLVSKECPKLLHFIEEGKSSTEVCEAIGLCAGADSACHSFGKLKDNGRCTAILANDTDYWRLEWNVLPWWKNKGCSPPRHIGFEKQWCTSANVGCCLSGWTQH